MSPLESLADAWRALERAARLPTQSYAWARACAASFGGHATVSTDDAVAPLTERHGRLELLGVDEISEPSDLLVGEGVEPGALVHAICARGLPLRLKRVPADSPTVAALEAHGRGHVRVRPEEGSPFIRLDAGWKEPFAKLTSRRRSDLKRARKRAEKEGPLRYEVHAPGPDEAGAVLDVAWDVESRSWRRARNGTLAQDGLRGPFFRRWAELAAEDRTLRVALMYAGETPVAMQLATAFADGYWLLKVGYDEAWSRCSPGMLLMAETIRRAAEEGLGTFELMGVVEDWTHVWTEDVRACVGVRTYPWSPRGATAWLADAAGALRAKMRRA